MCTGTSHLEIDTQTRTYVNLHVRIHGHATRNPRQKNEYTRICKFIYIRVYVYRDTQLRNWRQAYSQAPFKCRMGPLHEVCVTYEWVMSHMNVLGHIWTWHVTCEWVMSYVYASCHTWMSHVTNECVTSHINELCHIWMSHVTYEWLASHMNESRQHEWDVAHEWIMSYMDESCHK